MTTEEFCDSAGGPYPNLLDAKLLHREIRQLILMAGVLDDMVGCAVLPIAAAMAANPHE